MRWISLSFVDGDGPEGERCTLIVVNYISQMVATGVMRFADTHRVVSEIDIAVIAL